jgi:Protein of unknown function (DUF4232)
MVGRRAGTGLVAAAVALTVAGCGLGGSTKTVTVTNAKTVTTIQTVTTNGSAGSAAGCTGQQLTGSFALVPGSAGAGQIEYALTLKNGSNAPCSLRGVPKALLLGVSGAALPTHVTAAGGGATRLVLQPGASAVADARFSPDVAGTGDSQSGTCQPKAHTLQVTPNGGGVTDAAIKPATSVCEQGSLNFKAYGYAG